jgi:sugar transferase EpsL
VKRAIDVIVASSLLVILGPTVVIIAIAILALDGRPVFFRQLRAGRRGEPFTIVKFRTMRPPRPGETWYATDRQRLTRLGRILRKTSFDELPQLSNVLRGEMSLVGPRPLPIEYVSAYTPEEYRRLRMRPGLTSWAVVNGRHAVAFEDRLRLDSWYVDRWSLWLDIRILRDTIAHLAAFDSVSVVQDHDRIKFPERFRKTLEGEMIDPRDLMANAQMKTRETRSASSSRPRRSSGASR